MLEVTGYREIVAFSHLHLFTACEFQSGFAAQNNHPLVLRLVVPETLRTGVRALNDPFNLER